MTDLKKLAKALQTGDKGLFKEATEKPQKPEKQRAGIVEIQRGEMEEDKRYGTKQQIIPGQFKTEFVDDGSSKSKTDKKLYIVDPVPRRNPPKKISKICDRCNTEHQIYPLYNREIWVCDSCLIKQKRNEAPR